MLCHIHRRKIAMSLSVSTAAPTAKHVLSTSTLPPGERLSYWLEAVCSVYVQLDCDAPRDRAIFGHVESSRIGSIDVTQVKSNGPRVSRTTSQVRRSGEDYCLALLLREGHGYAVQNGRSAELWPGDFVVNDCTQPYDLHFDTPHHDLFVVRVPRLHLESHVGNLQTLTATAIRAATPAGRLLQSTVSTLHGSAETLHPAAAPGMGDAITNIVVAGLRSLPTADLRRPSPLKAYHLARAKTYVLDHLRDPDLSALSVAAALRMTPDHLHRIFREEPVSIAQLIWQSRLDACRRDLADAALHGRSVSAIAFSWGFNDAAHFSRSFRDRFGMAPREWRAGSRS